MSGGICCLSSVQQPVEKGPRGCSWCAGGRGRTDSTRPSFQRPVLPSRSPLLLDHAPLDPARVSELRLNASCIFRQQTSAPIKTFQPDCDESSQVEVKAHVALFIALLSLTLLYVLNCLFCHPRYKPGTALQGI